MTTIRNAERSRFSLIAEQTLALASNTNLVREVKNVSPNLMSDDVLRY